MNSKKRMHQSEIENLVEIAHQKASGTGLGDVRINILIKHNNSLMLDLLNLRLAPYGLSSVGYFVMMQLHSTHNNLANPSDLCVRNGETRANMTRICDDLTNKGLMKRVTNMEDRRRVDLSLTDEGIALLQTVVPALRKDVDALFSVFSEEEKATLVALLVKLNQKLEALA